MNAGAAPFYPTRALDAFDEAPGALLARPENVKASRCSVAKEIVAHSAIISVVSPVVIFATRSGSLVEIGDGNLFP